MFVTDGVASIRLVRRQECGNFLHITCKLHALHLVAEEIQKCYPNVDRFIQRTKAVLLKSPKSVHAVFRHS